MAIITTTIRIIRLAIHLPRPYRSAVECFPFIN
jgi:hypothetical protein